MKMFRTMLAVSVLALAGCASLGNEKPTTFRDQLAYAEAAHTGVIDALDSSLNAGMISSVAAGNVAAQADSAELALDAARAAYAAGDTAGANAKLVVALSALQALQDYLRAQGAKK